MGNAGILPSREVREPAKGHRRGAAREMMRAKLLPPMMWPTVDRSCGRALRRVRSGGITSLRCAAVLEAWRGVGGRQHWR